MGFIIRLVTVIRSERSGSFSDEKERSLAEEILTIFIFCCLYSLAEQYVSVIQCTILCPLDVYACIDDGIGNLYVVGRLPK